MARTRKRDGRHLRCGLPNRHAIFRPIGEVAVHHHERDGAAQRVAMADTGGHLHAIGLDLLAPAAAVPQLTTREIGVDVVGRQRQPGREAFDDGRKCGAVRLARCSVGQRHFPLSIPTGAGCSDTSRTVYGPTPGCPGLRAREGHGVDLAWANGRGGAGCVTGTGRSGNC